jgi:hypothetical protein
MAAAKTIMSQLDYYLPETLWSLMEEMSLSLSQKDQIWRKIKMSYRLKMR